MISTLLLKPRDIAQAIALLKAGEIVAIPTETVYGLAADATDSAAIQKIFSAKNRPSDHPLIVHIDALDKISDWFEAVPPRAQQLMERFWPGPLTIVLPKRNTVNDLITGGAPTVALRMPQHPIMREIIRQLGHAIVAPSANAHQKISPTHPTHVLKTLNGKIAAIIDDGICAVGIESTIIDLSKPVPTILRPGPITAAMIATVLGVTVICPVTHDEKVSGNMQHHYQPEKPLFLLPIEAIANLAVTEKNIAIIHYSMIKQYDHITYYQMSAIKAEYAKNLYRVLHAVDNTSATKILLEIPPLQSEWSDIHDRLRKAAQK